MTWMIRHAAYHCVFSLHGLLPKEPLNKSSNFSCVIDKVWGSSWRIVSNMKQRTLAMANGFERYGKKDRGGRSSWKRWSRWCRGRSYARWIEPHYPKTGNGRCSRWE